MKAAKTTRKNLDAIQEILSETGPASAADLHKNLSRKYGKASVPPLNAFRKKMSYYGKRNYLVSVPQDSTSELLWKAPAKTGSKKISKAVVVEKAALTDLVSKKNALIEAAAALIAYAEDLEAKLAKIKEVADEHH
jgi:hypothetical protein